MKTLTIDTSTEVLGVGLLIDGHVAGEVVTHIKKDHSTRLMPTIVSLLDDLAIKPDQLTSIVVSKGPGSYTGVRIGVTTAKSLAWALDIPLFTVSSLKVLTYNGRFFSGIICPFFDARRNNVYTSLYKWNDNINEQVEEDCHVSMEKWLEKLSHLEKEVLFLSPHIEQYKDMIIESMGEKAVILEGAYHYIKPTFLHEASVRNKEENIHLLSPNYIRLAEAEVNWLKRQEGGQ